LPCGRSADQSFDGVDGIDPRTMEAVGGELYAESGFQEKKDLDGVDGIEAASEEKGRVVGEGPGVAFSEQDVQQALPNFSLIVH